MSVAFSRVSCPLPPAVAFFARVLPSGLSRGAFSPAAELLPLFSGPFFGVDSLYLFSPVGSSVCPNSSSPAHRFLIQGPPSPPPPSGVFSPLRFFSMSVSEMFLTTHCNLTEMLLSFMGILLDRSLHCP